MLHVAVTRNLLKMAKFKQDIIKKIKEDPELFAIVASKSQVNPGALHMALHRNGKAINQYSVVRSVAEYLKVSPEDLVEETTELQK